MRPLMVMARVVLLALVFAVGTTWLGWWTLPIVALVYGAADSARWRRGWTATLAALAAALAWGGILGVDVLRGYAVATTAQRMSGVMQLPAWALYALTLAFAALLAGPASVVGSALGPRGAGGAAWQRPRGDI